MTTKKLQFTTSVRVLQKCRVLAFANFKKYPYSLVLL